MIPSDEKYFNILETTSRADPMYLAICSCVNFTVSAPVFDISSKRKMASLLSMQQILFMSMDKRLAVFLLDETAKNGTDTVKLTHEQIAKYMGSAREVVSRMLKYFAAEGIVSVSRGGIRLIDKRRLRDLIR